MPFRGRPEYNPCRWMIPPPGVSVGAVLRAANQNLLIAGGNHTFIYRQSAARHVSNTTCAVEWYHPQYGITQCSGDDSSPCNVTNRTREEKQNHLPICHSEGAKASRGIFPSCKFYLVLVLCPTWWIPPLRLRCGRNDTIGDVFKNSPTVSRVFHAAPPLISQGCALPASPGGELLYRALG